MKHKTSCTCGHSADVEKATASGGIMGKDIDLPVMLALLPCGLRNAFQQAVFNAFPEYVDAENPKLII